MKNLNFLTDLRNSDQVKTRLRPGNNQVKTTLRFIAILTMLLTLGVGNAWGATATMTGVSRFTSSTVNSKTAIKCGTGNYAGSMKVTVPANAKVLALYCAGWDGASVTVNITPTANVSPSSFNPTSDSGISGNGSDYTLSGSESTYLKTITLSSITSSTDITFANTAKKKQFVIWGARYVFNPTSPTNGTITSNSAQLSWSYGNSTDKYEIYYSTSSSTPTAGTSASIGISTIGTTKSADLTGLTANTTYYWWVRAVDPDGYCKSAWVAGSSFTTSSGSCTAPSSVSISGTSSYLPGQTISLTAAPDGGSGTTTYQWYKSGTPISGATSATYSKSGCTISDAGNYTCKVTTGATCSTISSNFAVRIYSVKIWSSGGGSVIDNYPLTYVSSNNGRATASLSASTTYEFKVIDNVGGSPDSTIYYGNGGTIHYNTSFDTPKWDFGSTTSSNCTLITGALGGGDFVFDVDITHNGSGAGYYVTVDVTYPEKDMYLSPGVWDLDNDKFAFYYFYKTGDDVKASGWSEFLDGDECGIYASIPTWDGMKMDAVRLKSTCTSPNWSDKDNQTSDITVSSNDLVSITGWDESNYTYGTYSTPTYTISYAKGTTPTGGGSISGSRDNESKTCGTAFTLPSSAVFTTTGYTQDGWATGDGGSKAYNLGGSYTTNAAQAFYPHWSETLHNVTVAYKCGETTVKSSTTINNVGIATTGSTTSPDITGYTWSTWSAMPSGVTTSTTPLTTRTITINATADSKTITANYTANVYNITYKDQGNVAYSGNNAGSLPATHTYGSATALVNGTKTGYTFGGWYTDASCTVSAGSSIGATAKTADFTLYAKWTATNYTLSYDLAGGSVASENPTSYTIESSAITLNNPTKAGYTFAGWTGTDLAEATTTVIIAAGSTGNRSYTATWTAKNDTYKTALHTSAAGWTSYASGVTKSGAGYSIPAPSSVSEGATSSCEDTHYHFAGWVANEHKGSPSGHIIAASGTTDATGATYWAVWEKETAAGSTESDVLDGNNVDVSSTATNQWTNPDITGSTGAVYRIHTMGTNGSSEVIRWNANGYLVCTSAPTSGANLKSVTVVTTANKNIGVYGSTTAYSASSAPSATSCTTLAATSSGATYNFTSDYGYIGLKGTGSSTYINSITITYGVDPTYGDPKAVCEACVATPSISGVSLTGSAFSTTSVPVQATGASAGENCSLAEYGFYWGGSANPTTNETASDNLSTGTFSATLTGPFTIGTTYHYRAFGTNEADNTGYSSDASFTLQNVSFSMHGHGGDAPATQVVPRGLKATAPSTPSETGYTFDGWWDNDSYTGSAWNFGTNTVGSGNVTLHAKWTEKPKYTITLNAGNGTISDANWTNTSGSTYTRTQANGDEEITLPTPSCNCAGWVFQGWSTTSKDNAASFTPDKEDGASFVPANNVTYYAVYRANATGGTTFNKITSTGDLTTGNYIFMSSTGYAMKNGVTSSRMDEVGGYTASNSSQTIDNANLVWTIAKFNSQVVIKNGANYLGIDANNNICLTTTPHFFTYTYNGTNNRWEFTSATKTSYQLVYSSYFKILTSQSTAIYLFKQGDGLTGNYYTNPDCSDISVTGTVSPVGSGTVTLTASSGKTGDKVYAMYTPDEDYNFDEWTISGTGSTLGSTTAVVTEITIGSANTTVTANFVAKDWKTITWKANGVALTGGDLGSASVKVENGFNITNLPPEPSSCDGTSTTFIGWVEESDVWSGKTNDVSGVTIYEDVSDFPTVTDDVTYHAVWARQNGSAAPATYAGTGVFTKITTMEELEVGAHYVLYGEKADDNTINGAMNNTFSQPSSGKYIFGRSAVTISDSKITNPATTIVWKLGGEENAYTLYSQNSSKYVEITIGDARGYSNPSSPTTSFTIDVNEGVFRIMSNHASAGGRMISLYNGTEFRSYANNNTDYVLYLYKYGSNYTYDQYLVKCCEDPGLEFGQTRYSLIREDLHGNTSGAYSTIELTYSSESSGTIRVWNQYDEDDNPEHSTKTAWQYTGANTWGTSPTTGGTAATAGTHAYFAITDAENGKATFYVKNATASNGRGTYRVALHQAADATHCETVTYCWIDVTLRDKFVDAVNGNTFPNADAHGPGEPAVTTPAESTRDADKDDDCHETTRRLVGWVKETDMESWYGAGQDRTRDLDDKKDDAKLVAPGATITTSGVTWYAVWGIEE